MAGDSEHVKSAPRLSRVSHVVVLALSTMTLQSTDDSPSVFENGNLKPGIYKIQNIFTETYVDIEVYSTGVCCHPANCLGEGRGLVCSRPSTLVHT